MAENALVPIVGVTSVIIAVAVLAFAAYARNRPSLLEGPFLMGVSFLGMTAGLVVLLVGEAAHGADPLIYVGGVVCLVGVSVLTGAVATLPHPEGEAEAGH